MCSTPPARRRCATLGCPRYGAGTCSAPRAWAPTRGPRSSTAPTRRTTCQTSSWSTAAACQPAPRSTRPTPFRRSRFEPPTRSGRSAATGARGTAKSPRRIFGAHAADLEVQLLRRSLTQFSNALAPLLGASPASRPPGSPNPSARVPSAALAADDLGGFGLLVGDVSWPQQLVEHDRGKRAQAEVVEHQREAEEVDRNRRCRGDAGGDDQRDGGNREVGALGEVDL